ncbi:transferase [Flammeovirga sp. SJP92]|uniref:transferase n=1 Tax=Flammeovirga sp. SJP92 TaxID=1775430 RepID=UPI000786D687|nr:transferase [Flammeovirga sp. SJP92]KXX72553.1 transferase [Flammeovirga sp. SJP92]
MKTEISIKNYKHSFSLGNKISRLVWSIVYLCLFRPFSSRLFKYWRVFILKIFKADIQWSSHVYSSVKIWAPWNLKLGKYSTLGPFVDCYNQGKIEIGDNTVISQKSYMCASSHDISDPLNNLILKPIKIKDQVWIAANSFIGPGITIGTGAVVGATSSVFSNIEEWSVVRGNPAQFVKKRILRGNEK